MRRRRSTAPGLVFKADAGITLTELLVAVAIGGVILLVIASVLRDVYRVAKVIEHQRNLATLRATITNHLDCISTLGIGPLTTLPLSCSTLPPVTLRRKDGSPLLPVGGYDGWNVAVQCSGATGSLKIRAARPGNDPLGKPFSTWPATTDLFGGTSRHCAWYFSKAANPSTPSPGIGDLECFHLGPVTGNALGATATCPVGYFAAGGGCLTLPPTVPGIGLKAIGPADSAFSCLGLPGNRRARAYCCKGPAT